MNASKREANQRAMSRRELLRLGGIGAFGLTLPQLWAGRRLAASSLEGRPRRQSRAKSCIVLFMMGGPAHQDTWDMKPDAPAEVRGEFKPAATSVTGIRICEHMPRLARQAHRYAIIRSVTHQDNLHSTSGYAMLTGRPHPRPAEGALPTGADFPSVGSVLARYVPPRSSLPSYVGLNCRGYYCGEINWPGKGAGFLGKRYDPLELDDDWTRPDFAVEALSLPADLSHQRLDQRRRLLDQLARTRRAAGSPLDADHERAFALLNAPDVRQAFDLSREPAPVRAAYPMNRFGQACLLARRLVERGVALVTIYWHRVLPNIVNWDTHANNFTGLKNFLLPSSEGAVATLLEDLHARGLLDETLVVWTSEFGRTPRINGQAGRDHHGSCNSVVLAGGGVRGGQVIGASDRLAAAPDTVPVRPGDLCATIYHCLGLDPHAEMHDSQGRPSPLAEGRVINELFGRGPTTIS
ncbi:MAG: DUF1501 domain-containing protein [Planctomycetes bacterium]|nr:DUF1501 domain-containing protein [Planctomycetota bacterium]